MTTSPRADVPRGAIVVVRDGRHPLSVLAMVASVFAGGIGLFGPANPNSALDRFIPEPYRTIYYGLLLISGLVVAVAVWLPDVRDRLIWERVGLLPFTGVLLVYPLALAYVAHGMYGLGAIMSSLFGVGGLWRVGVISLDLHRWKQTLRALKAEEAAAQEILNNHATAEGTQQ